MEYCDIGTIMNKHPETFNYHHNTYLINYFIQNILSDKYKNYQVNTEKSNPCLLQLYSLPYEIKNEIAKILFRQAFKGLQYIHKLCICHKDIKPENFVFSSEDSLLKFIDFSIGKILNPLEKDILINEPGGSIHFQAPELFDKMDSFYDPFKYDVWSLGITMYIFLVEQFPFDSDSELELQIMIAEKEINYPKELDDKVVSLFTKILTKNPDERLTNIDDILKHPYFNE